MKKSVKIGFPIVCVGVIAVTFGMISDIKKKVEVNKNNINQKEESHFENKDLNTVENEILNTVEIQTDDNYIYY